MWREQPLKTYNPYFGCLHKCYHNGCWVKKRLAHRIGRGIKCQLCYDFTPHLHEKRLLKVPREPRIFVGAHCDQFGSWVPTEVIERVLAVCRENPKEMWFFETKNPRRYLKFLDQFPENTVLSTTIETNIPYSTEVRGNTLPPKNRYLDFLQVSKKFPRHVSIEPIMKFDLEILVLWMKVIKPVKISVGYDSLRNCLPEPTKQKTMTLIKELEKFTEVERKFIKN